MGAYEDFMATPYGGGLDSGYARRRPRPPADPTGLDSLTGDGEQEQTGGLPQQLLDQYLTPFSPAAPAAPQAPPPQAAPEPAPVVGKDKEPLDLVGTGLRRAGDVGISALKGAIAIPEAGVGLMDLASGGHAGRGLQSVGFDPARAKAILTEYYSPEQKAANAAVRDATGVVGTLDAVRKNPSTIVQGVVESLPLMLGGAGVARGAAGLGMGALKAGALGEGVVSAGSAAEQTRQSSPGGLLTPFQSAASAASGAITSGLGLLGGKIARSLGIADVDTMLAGGGTMDDAVKVMLDEATRNPQAKQSLTRQILYGAFTEGILEELPQSIQEQVLQNAAAGRPLHAGVDQAAVMGALAGAVMGGGGNLIEGIQARQEGPGETLPELTELPIEDRVNARLRAQSGERTPSEEVQAIEAWVREVEAARAEELPPGTFDAGPQDAEPAPAAEPETVGPRYADVPEPPQPTEQKLYDVLADPEGLVAGGLKGPALEKEAQARGYSALQAGEGVSPIKPDVKAERERFATQEAQAEVDRTGVPRETAAGEMIRKTPKIEVTRNPDLEGEQADIQEQSIARLEADPAGQLAAYWEHVKNLDPPKPNLISVDEARMIEPTWRDGDPTFRAKNHQAGLAAARALAEAAYQQKLSEPVPQGETPEVVALAGGLGSGKSTAVENNDFSKMNAVAESTHTRWGPMKSRIDQARAAGRAITVYYVHAPAEGAWPRTLHRAMGPEARPVDINTFLNAQFSGPETLIRAADEYAGTPGPTVKFVVLDNSGGKGVKPTVRDVDFLRQVVHNRRPNEREVLFRALADTAHAAFESGSISEDVYRGALAGTGEAPRPRSAVREGLDGSTPVRRSATDRGQDAGQPRQGQPEGERRVAAPAAPDAGESRPRRSLRQTRPDLGAVRDFNALDRRTSLQLHDSPHTLANPELDVSEQTLHEMAGDRHVAALARQVGTVFDRIQKELGTANVFVGINPSGAHFGVWWGRQTSTGIGIPARRGGNVRVNLFAVLGGALADIRAPHDPGKISAKMASKLVDVMIHETLHQHMTHDTPEEQAAFDLAVEDAAAKLIPIREKLEAPLRSALEANHGEAAYAIEKLYHTVYPEWAAQQGAAALERTARAEAPVPHGAPEGRASGNTTGPPLHQGVPAAGGAVGARVAGDVRGGGGAPAAAVGAAPADRGRRPGDGGRQEGAGEGAAPRREPRRIEHFDEQQQHPKSGNYPRAGAKVAGLQVLDWIPNRGSIGASVAEPYRILPGVREIPLDPEWNAAAEKTFAAADDIKRAKDLAKAIGKSGKIEPLIVGIGPDGPYIIEGVHRLAALHELGKTSFPALVVVERGEQFMATAYHGSPHDFEKFSTDKIGTGEGNAVFGHGLYFAGKREVAEFYKEKLSKRITIPGAADGGSYFVIKGVEFPPGRGGHMALDTAQEIDSLLYYLQHKNGPEDLKNPESVPFYLRSKIEDRIARFRAEDKGGHGIADDDMRALADFYEQHVKNATPDQIAERPKGKLYEVDLAPEEDDYLLWDKPLTEQSHKVADALRNLPDDVWDDWANISQMNAPLDAPEAYTGGQLVKGLEKVLEDPALVSEKLAFVGIPGIKFLDRTSRGAGSGYKTQWSADGKTADVISPDGSVQNFPTFAAADAWVAKHPLPKTFNYVIFDDSHITIKQKYMKRRHEAEQFSGPVVKRAKNFQDFGFYDVTVNGETHQISRDPESGWWYVSHESPLRGKTAKRYATDEGTGLIGFNKAEAVKWIEDHTGGSRGPQYMATPPLGPPDFAGAYTRGGGDILGKPGAKKPHPDIGLNIGKYNLPPDVASRLSAAVEELDRQGALPRNDPMSMSEVNKIASDIMKWVSPEQIRKQFKKADRETVAIVTAFRKVLMEGDERVEKARDTLITARQGGSAKDVANAHEDYLKAASDFAADITAFSGKVTESARILAFQKQIIQAGRTAPEQFRDKLFKILHDQGVKKVDVQGIFDLYMKSLSGMAADQEAFVTALRKAFNVGRIAKITELWKAGVLSGPSTPVANAIGNSLVLATDIAKTGMAGVLDSHHFLTGGTRERYVGEMGAQIAGIKNALPDAINKLMKDLGRIGTFKIEDIDLEGGGKLEYQVGAISGVKGRVIRSPFRILNVTDNFFKALIGGGESAKLAYRDGMKRGYAGHVLEQHMRDVMERIADGREEDMVAEIVKAQNRLTFQTETGPVGSGLQSMKRSQPWMEFIIPFIRTPANIGKYTWRMTPGGFLAVGYDIYKGKPKGDVIDNLALTMVGSAFGAAMVAAAREGWLTGSGPADRRERALKISTGWQPYSLRIRDAKGKDHYWSFSRFEPIGAVMGIAADIVESQDEAKAKSMLAKLVGSFMGNFTSKSYLQGLADFFTFWHDPINQGEYYLKQLGGSVVPNIAARSAVAQDPVLRDTEDESFFKGLGKQIVSRIPGASDKLDPKYTATGRVKERGGTWLSRFASPSAYSEARDGMELEKELIRIGYIPSEVKREVRLPGGGKIKLTDREYDQLQRANYRTAAEAARLMRSSRYRRLPDTAEEGGTESKEHLMRQLFLHSRSTARGRISNAVDFRRRMREAIREARARARARGEAEA